MTNTHTKIKSNSPLIQPFVVHPDATTLPKEKILEMQQSSEILKDNACAILEVNINNLDKMQEDFVIPQGSVVEYGSAYFTPYLISKDWHNSAQEASPAGSWYFNVLKQKYSDQTITIIVPIEPPQGSDFCFKGDEEHQDFKDAYFPGGFRKPLEVRRDGSVYDGFYVANFRRLNLLPFGFEVQEEEVKGSVFMDLDKAIHNAEVKEMEAQEDYSRQSRITEALKGLRDFLKDLQDEGIEVEVKVKK